MISTILTLAFYLVMAVFSFYSILALYSLLKFGRSKTISYGVAAVYVVISFTLFGIALANLNKLNI